MKLKDLIKMPNPKPSPKGIDCKCCASGYSDCGCGADWSDNTGYNQSLKEFSEIEIPSLDENEVDNLMANYFPSNTNSDIRWECAKAICTRFATHNHNANVSKKVDAPALERIDLDAVKKWWKEETGHNLEMHESYDLIKSICSRFSPPVQVDVEAIERIIDTTATFKNGPYADELNSKTIAKAIADYLKKNRNSIVE